MPTLPTLDRPKKQNHDTSNPAARELGSVSAYGRAKSKGPAPPFSTFHSDALRSRRDANPTLVISSDERRADVYVCTYLELAQIRLKAFPF